MPETGPEKLHWLLGIIEEGKKSLESVLLENSRLREAVADSQRKLSSNPQVLEVEEQYTTVSNLFVAALQLHATWTSAEALTVLKELLCNVVGATGFELYVRAPNGELVSLGLQSFAGRPPPATAEASIKEALEAREARLFSRPPWAVAPILLSEKASGVLVISELLPHKGALGPGDKEMLHFLSEHLGAVLLRAHRLEKAGQSALGADASLGELVRA